MPQPQPLHDHPGPDKSLPLPPVELDSNTSITDTVTAAAVASALRAASNSPAASGPHRPPPPASHSHLKSSSLSPATRPPRTSSLLPPPRGLQKTQFEFGPSDADAVDGASSGVASEVHDYRYQHTSTAERRDPPELNTSPDRDDPGSTRRPTNSQYHPRSAQTSHGRFDRGDSQGPSTSSHSPADSLNAAPTWPSSEPPRPDQHSKPPYQSQYQYLTSAPSFVPLPPLELLPPLDKNISGPLDPILDSPRTAPQPPSRQMPQDIPRDDQPLRGHGRRRSSRGSNDAEKSKTAKPPSQKAMLSRALQKANTAVQLDNAQNLEGARVAYSEACDLLQQVLKRTSADEDKRKLEAIVSAPPFAIVEKELPREPETDPQPAPNIRKPHRRIRSNTPCRSPGCAVQGPAGQAR